MFLSTDDMDETRLRYDNDALVLSGSFARKRTFFFPVPKTPTSVASCAFGGLHPFSQEQDDTCWK